jgi:hypothetical protein
VLFLRTNLAREQNIVSSNNAWIYQEKIANFLGQALVNGKKKCEVRFSVAIVEKKEMEQKLEESKQEKELEKIEPKEYLSLPVLKIGKTIAKIPIIQGGMAVRVSLHNLAGAVAKKGELE